MNDYDGQKYKEAEEENEEYRKMFRDVLKERNDLIIKTENQEEALEGANREIIKLKAKLYDLMTKE